MLNFRDKARRGIPLSAEEMQQYQSELEGLARAEDDSAAFRDIYDIVNAKTPLLVGVNRAFIDKTLQQGYSKAAWRVSHAEILDNPMLLPRLIRKGYSWTPAVFRDNHRKKENFVQAQVVALDFDDNGAIDTLMQDALISTHAFFLHASPSHTPQAPRTRVLFLLDAPVQDMTLYELLVEAMLDRLAYLRPDVSAKDASRQFHGARLAMHVSKTQHDAILDAETCNALVYAYEVRKDALRAAREAARPIPQGMPADSDKARKYVEKALDEELRTLATTPKGGRNHQLFVTACNLFSMVAGGWPIVSDGMVERELERVAEGIGLARREIQQTLASARRSAEPREWKTD